MELTRNWQAGPENELLQRQYGRPFAVNTHLPLPPHIRPADTGQRGIVPLEVPLEVPLWRDTSHDAPNQPRRQTQWYASEVLLRRGKRPPRFWPLTQYPLLLHTWFIASVGQLETLVLLCQRETLHAAPTHPLKQKQAPVVALSLVLLRRKRFLLGRQTPWPLQLLFQKSLGQVTFEGRRRVALQE